MTTLVEHRPLEALMEHAALAARFGEFLGNPDTAASSDGPGPAETIAAAGVPLSMVGKRGAR